MGILDAAFGAVAKTLCGIFTDKQVTIVRRGSDYSLTAGTESNIDETEYEADASPPFDYEAREINGTSVLAGDARMFLAASGLAIEPEPETDQLVYHAASGVDETYRIVNVARGISGDRAAFFELQLRK